MLSKAEVVILWQVDANNKREIRKSLLTSYNFEQDQLFFTKKAAINFDTTQPLYAFVQEGPFIFKTHFRNQQEASIMTSLPQEIKFLDEKDCENVMKSFGVETDKWISIRRTKYNEDLGLDYMKVKSMKDRTSRDQDFLNEEMGISLEEEDKMFAGKRESPRARPKNDKFVTLSKMGEDVTKSYKLFDLSRGGMAFIVDGGNLFKKEEGIKVGGFNDYLLDDPLYGTVMSIREIDGTSQFKIGIKFLED